MPTPPLGKLERIAQLRAVWPSERDFSMWLAEEANLAQLAASLGIDELELEATEKNVGPFKADILCKDTRSGHWVLIEDQLSRTDHSHLGQLLTYAAGLQAVTIVWIAAPFTEEHRTARVALDGRGIDSEQQPPARQRPLRARALPAAGRRLETPKTSGHPLHTNICS